MERKASFSQSRGLGFFLALPVAVCAVAAILLYRKTGVTTRSGLTELYHECMLD